MSNPLYLAERCRDLAEECRAIAAVCLPQPKHLPTIRGRQRITARWLRSRSWAHWPTSVSRLGNLMEAWRHGLGRGPFRGARRGPFRGAISVLRVSASPQYRFGQDVP
jgi:hypothetical protein